MPKPYTLKYERSPAFRYALIDNAATVVVGDQLGAKITVNFSRLESIPLTEEAIEQDNGSITLISGTTPTSELRRVIEFSAEMRPDHAMNIMNGIRAALIKLPREAREKYQITDEGLHVSSRGNQS